MQMPLSLLFFAQITDVQKAIVPQQYTLLCFVDKASTLFQETSLMPLLERSYVIFKALCRAQREKSTGTIVLENVHESKL